MYNYTAGTKTVTEVVTLAQAKANLRIDHDYQNDLIQALVNAAVEDIENYTGRAIAKTQYTATGSTFINKMQLRYTPVAVAPVITYYDENNAAQTLSDTLYAVFTNSYGDPELVFTDYDSLPALYDRSDAVKIVYSAGMEAGKVPECFKMYTLLMVNKLYENPGDTPLRYHSFAKNLIFHYKKQVSDVFQ